MNILIFLAVIGWRKASAALQIAWVWFRELWVFFALGAFALVIAGLIYGAVQRNKQELAWLAEGICEPVTEQLYTPPPQSQCVQRNQDGMCVQSIYIPQSPYMRTRVRCDGQDDFWRRSSSIPVGSFAE